MQVSPPRRTPRGRSGQRPMLRRRSTTFRARATLRAWPIVTAIAAVSCGDASAPHLPAAVMVDAGDGQEATVTNTLARPLVVRVTDAAGGPMADVVVTWSTEADGGALTPASSTTDGSGRASTEWTLGTRAGSNTARATVAGLAPVDFEATARSGPPAEMTVLSGSDQQAEVGEPLPELLRVTVVDAWDNPIAGIPVKWSSGEGAGTVEGTTDETDTDGMAEAAWIMGRLVGTVQATARVASGSIETSAEATFVAAAEPTTLNLTLARAYLVQSVQRWEGDVPLVAGREALLRVFVEESRNTAQRATVGVRVRDAHGNALTETLLEPPPGFAPGPGLSEAVWADSYNLKLPGDWITPGIRLDVQVDPEDLVAETNEGDNELPGGAEVTPTVVDAPPVEVTFVPIRINGDTGEIDNTELLLWDVGRIYPVNEVRGNVRGSALDLSQYDLRESSDFPSMVASVLAARLADGAGQYYYGVLPRRPDAAWGGWALIGGPAAVGIEGDGMLVAHELGHNWGRFHPPCGTAGGVDPNFPNADGVVGVYGYDALNSRIQAADRTDIMSYSYCGDLHWISDYTYEGVLAYRTAEATAASPRRVAQSSLIVWGRVEGDSLILEPAFRAFVPPSLPTESGRYRVEGFDAEGSRVFDLSFRPTRVAHAAIGEGVFAFAVPLPGPTTVASLRLTDGTRDTEVRVPTRPGAAVVSVERIDPDHLRFRWDSEAHPMLVVRDAPSGLVMSFARGGEVTLRLPEGQTVDVSASTGPDARKANLVRR